MKRHIASYFICFLLFASPVFSSEIPLCDIPNWDIMHDGYGSHFAVYLDSRHYNFKNFGNISNPEGGVKLELDLWEEVVQSLPINKVEFVNLTTGESHIVTAQTILEPSGFTLTEYALWLGCPKNIVGNWRLLLTSEDTTYYFDFALSQDMLETQAKPPLPTVNVSTVKKNGKIVAYNVTGISSSPYLRGYAVRLRITENNGNDTLYRTATQYPTGSSVKFQVPGCLSSSLGEDCDLSDNPARMEVKSTHGSPWGIYGGECAISTHPARTLQDFKFPSK